MELKGKCAIVTGAARGIGRGMALKLADAGANLALVDLGNPADATLTYNLAAQTELSRTVEEVKRRGVRAAAILADVTRWGGLPADGQRGRVCVGRDRYSLQQRENHRGRSGRIVQRADLGSGDGS